MLPWESGWWASLASGSVSDQVTAATAVITAILVLRQLTGLRDDRKRADETLRAQTAQSRSEAESARANLLLRIDERFSSLALVRSRKRWLELRAECRAEFSANGLGNRDAFVRARMIDRIDVIWDAIQDGGTDDFSLASAVRAYDLIMQLANWMEVVGLLVRQGLVPPSDIQLLYRSVIRSAIYVIEGHVPHREPGPNPTSYENAIWLNRQFDMADRP